MRREKPCYLLFWTVNKWNARSQFNNLFVHILRPRIETRARLPTNVFIENLKSSAFGHGQQRVQAPKCIGPQTYTTYQCNKRCNNENIHLDLSKFYIVGRGHVLRPVLDGIMQIEIDGIIPSNPLLDGGVANACVGWCDANFTCVEGFSWTQCLKYTKNWLTSQIIIF